MIRTPTSLPLVLLRTALATALLTGLLSSRVSAQEDFVARANGVLIKVPADKRSDTVLLPLLAKTTPPPAVIPTQERAALLAAQGPGFDDAKAWAQRDEQKAVLEAIKKVTEKVDPREAFAFAQPYGFEGVSQEMVQAQMYTELGDPPTLAAAQHLYMPAVERAGVLSHVEASRLAQEGKPQEAIDTLVNWFFFSRQMADRAFLEEKRWAMQSMKLALERILDVAYQDSRTSPRKLETDALKKVIETLRDRNAQIDRILLPEGDFAAREQLISRVMEPGGGTSEESFAPTMARVASQDRPLRLFSAVAYWEEARRLHAGERESREMLQGVQADWGKRWNLNPFDRIQNTITDYNRRVANNPKFAVLHMGLDEVAALFPLRQQLNTQVSGTRMALGVYGFFLQQKGFPPALTAIRPRIVAQMAPDPYSTRGQDFRMVVPSRDFPGKPFVIRVYPPEPMASFQVPVPQDQFVLFSVGPDDSPGNGQDATQGAPGRPGDYLVWPPVVALVRQRLIDTNQLK